MLFCVHQIQIFINLLLLLASLLRAKNLNEYFKHSIIK